MTDASVFLFSICMAAALVSGALAMLAPLIYYKSRLVFFDVLIKKGIVGLLLVVAAACYFALTTGPLRRLAAAKTGFSEATVFALAGVFFVTAWTSIYPRIEPAIDRFLFRRPNYTELLGEITSGIKQFVESGPMIRYVCNRLATGIPADYVHYIEPGRHESAKDDLSDEEQEARIEGSECRIQLVVGDSDYGSLLIGPRPRGYPYQSEDIGFLQTVAVYLTGMLRNVDLRLERDRQENLEAELREMARQAELRALKAQINPHFLFNALNNLADMAADDPSAAERAVANLASVFRFTLEAADKESVSLGEEADFIEAYLEIEKIRFEDRLEYQLSIPKELESVRIPPMLIQPLVENAVKHGISPLLDRPGKIEITARFNGSAVEVTIRDNGVGFSTGADRTGIGLSNVRRRVDSLFGRQHWKLISKPGEGTLIRISFPVAMGPAAIRDRVVQSPGHSSLVTIGQVEV